jgi:antitoxin (DNA-binding transcriptional repressor) of toxin-antitoxin stability system
MEATLTELHRKAGKLVRPVIQGKRKLTISEHGQPCVESVPIPTIDREKAIAALRAIGPVPLPRRK